WETPRLSRAYCRQTAHMALGMLRLPRLMRAMLGACTSSGAFAAHHAGWLARVGVPQCQYYRTPVVDDAGPQWQDQRRRLANKAVPRLLLIGHLRGIATLSGLYLFFEEALPHLERLLGRDGFEIHVVGGYDPPARLRRALDHPSVRLRGQIEPA